MLVAVSVVELTHMQELYGVAADVYVCILYVYGLPLFVFGLLLLLAVVVYIVMYDKS